MATNDDLLTEVNAAIHVETSKLLERIAELEHMLEVCVDKHNSLAFAFLSFVESTNVNWHIQESFMDAISEHSGFDIKAWAADFRRRFEE